MPWKELITSIEDREFTSGPGNWTGDIDWRAGPHFGQFGYLAVEAYSIGETKQFKLSYPRVTALPNKQFILHYLSGTEPLPLHDLLRQVFLTDGVYQLPGTYFSTPSPPEWASYNFIINTPPDWNKTNVALLCNFTNLANHYDILYTDNFSLKTSIPERTDHLPLMGVH